MEKEINLLSSIREIDEDAFSGCKSLVSIALPESISEIGIGVFSGCTSLVSINIPKLVAEIHSFTFEDCIAMKPFETQAQIDDFAFVGCPQFPSLYSEL